MTFKFIKISLTDSHSCKLFYNYKETFSRTIAGLPTE